MADQRRLKAVPDRPVLPDDAEEFEPLGEAVSMSAPVPGTAHKVTGTASAPGTGTDPVPGTGGTKPVPGTGTGPGTDDDEAGRELRPGEQILAFVRHWQFMMDVTFARLTTKSTGLWFGLTHAKPESVAEHHDYVKSGQWIPEDADDGLATFLRIAGKLDGYLIGKPGVAVFNAMSAIWARPLRRFLIGLVLVGLTMLIVYLHHRTH